jgi:hypothetical protein
MLTSSPPASPTQRSARGLSIRVRAVRPALTDLRFKGDPWVVDHQDGTASLCLGDYALVRIGVLPIDVPSLNRTLHQVRLGQTRREFFAHLRGVLGK